MGCGQSKIENEEAVSRCKDRKQFMKEAVSIRNAFAAAHAAYTMSLKNTGAALSDFAHGEVQNPNYIPTTNPTTPLHPSLPSTSASGAPQPPPPPPPPLPDTLLPPPPPLHRAASMPEMKLPPKPDHAGLAGPTIIEEDDEEDAEAESLVMRRKRSGSNNNNSRRENDPPPPPPPQQQQQQPLMTSAAPPLVESRAAPELAWADYLFQSNQESMMGPSLGAVQEEVKMEEIHRKVVENVDVGVEVEEEEVRKSTKVEAAAGGSVGKSSVKKGKGSVGTGERRTVKGSVNLLQIFVELDDHFLKASESAHEVSKMLEATRLHYHSNFADNRGNDFRL